MGTFFEGVMKVVTNNGNLGNDDEDDCQSMVESEDDDSEQEEKELLAAQTQNDDRELWIDQQEQEDEKEAAIFKAQHVSQAMMDIYYQKMYHRIEKDFLVDLFSIPFIEDQDLKVANPPTPYSFEKTQTEQKTENQKKIVISVLQDEVNTVKPISVDEITMDWIGLNFDFSKLTNQSTQLANRLSGSTMTSPLRAQTSEGTPEEGFLQKLQFLDKKRKISITDDLSEAIFEDLKVILPYNPDDIEDERFYESVPKQETKTEVGITGFFVNLLKKADDVHDEPNGQGGNVEPPLSMPLLIDFPSQIGVQVPTDQDKAEEQNEDVDLNNLNFAGLFGASKAVIEDFIIPSTIDDLINKM